MEGPRSPAREGDTVLYNLFTDGRAPQYDMYNLGKLLGNGLDGKTNYLKYRSLNAGIFGESKI